MDEKQKKITTEAYGMGPRIRTARKAMGLTLKALTSLMGSKSKGHAKLSNWERATSEPDLKSLGTLAAALRVTPSYLAFGDQPNVARVPVMPCRGGCPDIGEARSMDLPTEMTAKMATGARLIALRAERDGDIEGYLGGDIVVVDTGRRDVVGHGERLATRGRDFVRVCRPVRVPGRRLPVVGPGKGRPIRPDEVIGRIVGEIAQVR